MKTTTLTTCRNIQEAALIKGNLANNGIPCMVTNQNYTTLMPHFNRLLGSGVQVLVFEVDLEKAAKILYPQNSVISKCPFCNSEHIKLGLGKFRFWKLFVIVLSIFVATPINNIEATYHCINCKSDFN